MIMKPTLLGQTLDELKATAAAVGLRPFAAKQMAAWLYQRGATDIEQMTDLPKRARAELAERYELGRTAPIAEAHSSDGTAKFLFPGSAGRDVEAVYIPDRERATLCVSSQAGCRMSCRFCMTGQGGWQGNLSAGQIINQVLSIPKSDTLTNIVFMGMGEPTDNLPAVLAAIEILTAPWGFGWSPKRITVSTIGNLQGLRELLEKTKVHIAVSVHSPFGAERADLMPIEKAYPLTDIVALLRNYDWSGQRRLSLEYTMFRGVNDDVRHARALARLVKGIPVRVNLIRFHRTPGFEGEPAGDETMVRFRDQLNADGVTATIRASRGEDIFAACGMLAGAQKQQTDKKIQS